MSLPRRWIPVARVILTAAALLAGCRAPTAGGAAGAGGATRPPAGFTVMRQAESVPIAAIAFRAPYLWAGTEHGLRRWNVSTEESEWIGPAIGPLGRNVSALSIDGAGGVWVATEAGVGRITQAGSSLHYEPKGALATITWLLPTRDDGGAWAGGPAGLYRLAGKSWTIFDFLHDVPVTSLDLDADGVSVWVGTQGRGLLHVDHKGGQPILPPSDAAGSERIIGTALNPGDVRVVGETAGDGGRIIFLTRQGPEVYRTQPEAKLRFVRLTAFGGQAALVAGPEGAEGLYTLRPLPRGESPPPGGLRLIGVGTAAGNRYAAVPLPVGPLPDVTVVAIGATGAGSAGAPGAAAEPGELWFGSRRMGVARAGKKGPVHLPGGELTGDADRLTVACTTRDHCYVVAGGDHAWLFDGARFREASIGEVAGGRALAVVPDRTGALLGVSSDPKLAGLVLTKLAPAPAPAAPAPAASAAAPAAPASASAAPPPVAPAAPDDWRPLERFPLEIPAGSPAVSFAAFAPDGRLWLGLGVLDAANQEQGRGAVEIDLAAHKIIHHGEVGGAHPDAESLPLPHDLTGILFDGTATWFSARSGMSRWQESELRRWGENEHMTSEVCYAVTRGLDGAIWAGTSAGVGRFEGKSWRFAAADEPAAIATHAFVRDAAGRMWVATARGLRVLAPGDVAPRGKGEVVAAGELVVDGEMLDATVDRYGRVWALGATSLVMVEPPPR